ncbi:hypothetical protein [Mesorhizobium huakuii]|uniref:hypothetical protein n=1 Tax=Mesorhizobium huakuii TaxID=28104 RepID=UPI001FD40FE7|nr:hypothetical protein [Mesorhizobium huakuii]
MALKFGDTLSADKLREVAWPAGAVPAGAFKTTEELLTKDVPPAEPQAGIAGDRRQ